MCLVVELLWARLWLTVVCVCVCADKLLGEDGAGDDVQMRTDHPKLLKLDLFSE